MAFRVGLGLALAIVACGGRTLDNGEYGDSFERGGFGGRGGGSGGAFGGKGGGKGSGKGGTPSAGGGSGTGGEAAGSGSGGFAGNPFECGPTGHAGPPEPLIDDMEDGDNFILPFEGRRGSWYAYNDMSGFQSPLSMVTISPLPHAGTRAAYTEGYGFDSWGAGIGFLLNDNCPYDASRYHGVLFSARSAGPLTVRFSINTEAVTPVEHGGTCLERCWDAHGTLLTVSESWNYYAIPFQNLVQEGFGSSVPFDRGRLTSVQFQIPAYQTFELWIDDVSFY